MEETLTAEQATAGNGRDELGRWKPGVSGNPDGPKPLTEEEKQQRELRKIALEKAIEDYTYKLSEALKDIHPVLIAKAMEGDMQAIKEVNDRVMGKPKQQTEVNGTITNNNLNTDIECSAEEHEAVKQAFLKSVQNTGSQE